MTTLILGVALVGIVFFLGAVLIFLKKSRQTASGQAEASLPYRKRDSLLTKAELSFYLVLLQAVGDDWRVFVKVRLLDLLWLPHGTTNAQAHRNRVQAKHMDFVLCSLNDISPSLVIELDDASHKRTDRAARDIFVDKALQAAGIPILHVPAKRAYSVAELAGQIATLTNSASVAAEPPSPRPQGAQLKAARR